MRVPATLVPYLPNQTLKSKYFNKTLKKTFSVPAHSGSHWFGFSQFSGQTEVNNPQVEIVSLLAKNNVERLQVQVDEPSGVNELNPSGDLANNVSALLLSQDVVWRRRPLQQIPTRQKLSHQDGMNPGSRLVESHELQNEFAIPQRLQGV